LLSNDLYIHESLVSGFKSSLDKYPNNIALEIEEQLISYNDLDAKACQLANLLESSINKQEEFCVGILSGRSLSAFQGILATLYSSKAYLPFDLKAKPERIKEIINNIQCRTFVVDIHGVNLLLEIEGDLPSSHFIFPSLKAQEVPVLSSKHKTSCFEDVVLQPQSHVTATISSEDLAYVLFTSGSTGKPKGVPISHKNICAYIGAMQKLYPLTEHDRCTQAFDFTFDPSVHDMFVTWFSGACLCVMDDRARLGAQYFIKKKNITVWNTLPSIVKLCLKTRSFSEKYLSNLKYVFFNGEPLFESVVTPLQERARNSKLINLYGLTETTVNLSHYCWEKASSSICRNGVVPIGHVFPNITIKLTSLIETLQSEEEKGLELSLSGPQIFSGYLSFSDSERSKNKSLFFEYEEMDGSIIRFMRTGDLVEVDENGLMFIVGRSDEQVKISGHRVDLNLIRYTLEQASQSIDALVLKHENEQGDIQLIGVLKGESFDETKIKHFLAERLPLHMQLSRLFFVNDYPYLVSGKVDKRELLERLSISD